LTLTPTNQLRESLSAETSTHDRMGSAERLERENKGVAYRMLREKKEQVIYVVCYEVGGGGAGSRQYIVRERKR
jgi:hypothetical protein